MQSHSFLLRLISDFITNFFFFIKIRKVCEAPKNTLLALTILQNNSMTINVKERYDLQINNAIYRSVFWCFFFVFGLVSDNASCKTDEYFSKICSMLNVTQFYVILYSLIEKFKLHVLHYMYICIDLSWPYTMKRKLHIHVYTHTCTLV